MRLRPPVSLLLALPAAVLILPLLVRAQPRAVARFNRDFTNRMMGRFAGRAPGFGIVIHRGRRSGRLYRTPVNVFRVPDGFLIALTYGRTSEWARNVPAAHGCEIETRGRVYALGAPVIVHDAAHRHLPPVLRPILRIGGVKDYLRLVMVHAPRGGEGR
jgi:deazaflavin-dependent oxidoreductase (nitroreductase family)